jgi:hypothetical protein
MFVNDRKCISRSEFNAYNLMAVYGWQFPGEDTGSPRCSSILTGAEGRFD